MRFFSFILFFLFFTQAAQAINFKLLGYQEFSSDHKVGKIKLGGISGVVWDEALGVLWAITDDRGRSGDPHIFKMHVKWDAAKFKIEKIDVLELSFKDKQKTNLSFDMEGLALLPWGNLLVSTEGDFNRKPRLLPQLLEFKYDGTYIREFALGEEYIFEKTGKAKKGCRDNRCLEGLAHTPGGKFWLINEEPLIQDQKKNEKSFLRLSQYEMPEAWQIKFKQQYLVEYPFVNELAHTIHSNWGVAELLAKSEEEIWLVARAAQVDIGGLGFLVKIFSVNSKTGGTGPLKPVEILDLNQWAANLKPAKIVDNIEAISWGPDYKGSKTLLLASDNNFSKNQKTQFWWVQIEQ